MPYDDLAQKLFGAKRAESNAVLTDATTGTIHGRALTDSADGSVVVEITGDVTNPEVLDLNVGQVLLLVVIGCIASATMIIPGVSGSMVLMLLGYYTPILNAVSNLKDAIFALDFAAMLNPILTLAPFGIGVVLGIFGVAKLIEWLLARFPTYTYCGVLGLVISSPVAILIRADLTGVTFGIVLISLVTFAIGFAAAMLLAKHSAE